MPHLQLSKQTSSSSTISRSKRNMDLWRTLARFNSITISASCHTEQLFSKSFLLVLVFSNRGWKGYSTHSLPNLLPMCYWSFQESKKKIWLPHSPLISTHFWEGTWLLVFLNSTVQFGFLFKKEMKTNLSSIGTFQQCPSVQQWGIQESWLHY